MVGSAEDNQNDQELLYMTCKERLFSVRRRESYEGIFLLSQPTSSTARPLSVVYRDRKNGNRRQRNFPTPHPAPPAARRASGGCLNVQIPIAPKENRQKPEPEHERGAPAQPLAGAAARAKCRVGIVSPKGAEVRFSPQECF